MKRVVILRSVEREQTFVWVVEEQGTKESALDEIFFAFVEKKDQVVYDSFKLVEVPLPDEDVSMIESLYALTGTTFNEIMGKIIETAVKEFG